MVFRHFIGQTIKDLKPRILRKVSIEEVEGVCYICGLEAKLVAMIEVLNKDHTPYSIEKLYICEECYKLINT